MKQPSKIWWNEIKKVANTYLKEKSTTYTEELLKDRMIRISKAIEDLLSYL